MCVLHEAPWSSRYSGSITMQKVAIKHEFEAGLAMLRLENSVNPAVNGYVFRIREP